MARNYRQPGNTVTIAAPAIVKSGDFVILNALGGVAQFDAAQGADLEVTTEGVWILPKAAGAGIDQGGAVYWHSTPGNCSATASGGVLIGACIEAAGTGATTVAVRLNGVSLPDASA
jgi:predicted RecA/RadA family phage recombinase